jgi:DNA-directed RNA polymerase beta subunit
MSNLLVRRQDVTRLEFVNLELGTKIVHIHGRQLEYWKSNPFRCYPYPCTLQHTTHLEVGEGSMLSALATLTPFSDFNQSPRNMYQCQV